MNNMSIQLREAYKEVIGDLKRRQRNAEGKARARDDEALLELADELYEGYTLLEAILEQEAAKEELQQQECYLCGTKGWTREAAGPSIIFLCAKCQAREAKHND